MLAHMAGANVHVLALGGFLDPKHLLAAFRLAGLFAVIFAETGLLIGFFLPGDSLLVLAGLISAVGVRKAGIDMATPNLAVVLIGVSIAAIVGAQVGYYIGWKAGPALFRRPNSRLFKKEYVEKGQSYFDKYGGSTIIIARFVPIVRTFANPMAGVGKMDHRTFTIYNIIGGLLWALGITMLGFVLGKTIPGAENHLFLIEAIVIVVSLSPAVYEVLKARREKAAELSLEANGKPTGDDPVASATRPAGHMEQPLPVAETADDR